QHFLIAQAVLRKVIEAADLRPDDIVLEIGPGIGTLTQELAQRVKRVIAIEKDPKMIDILKETLKDFKNIEVAQGDIRNLKLEIRNYKVVANLPYYITSPVIRKFLENPEARPLTMVLMVQKEVAQRICAKPPDMTLLAVSVQFYAEPKIIDYVSKKSFWPAPKVDSAIIKIIPHKSASAIRVNPLLFFKIVKAGFSQPRKQLANNLSKIFKTDRDRIQNWLLANSIQPTQRAETLSMEDWIKLTKSFIIR
ncbi:MAG: 16S rRNA (adenine(1518)-N(6)/adenine(1519)-N(6))-dimethyltransferase RsmA, partial [Candidatus Wildermuthbacteria bacterium]|nr:16S rRNA (adenine(1518)-N(6)/adenine(1519)-N(6))-dimethyltransferase RsmA [Candidatus Wildermuthbacteria bacterium]